MKKTKAKEYFSNLGSRISNIKLEFIFLFIALVWGILQVFLVPPFSVADEDRHFFRAWGISQLDLRCDKKSNIYLPKNVGELPVHFYYTRPDINPQNNPHSFSLKQIINGSYFHEKVSHDNAKYYSNFCSYNPLDHTPQAISVFLGRISGQPPLGIFYFARLTNLLVAIGLIFLAIRKAPFGKIIFLFLGLLPMTIFQMASLSGDAVQFGGILLFTSLILYYAQKIQLENKDLLTILGVSLLTLNLKPGYISLVLLFFVLMPKQFSSKKKYLLFSLGSAFANILLFLFFLKTMNPNTYIGFLPNTIPSQQLHYVAQNPLSFYNAFITTFNNVGIKEYFESMIGRLGWYNFQLPEGYILLISIAFLLLLTSIKEKIRLNLWQRFIFILSFLLTTATILAIEYVYFTPVGRESILGFQGRYFIPIMPLLIFALYKIDFKHKYTQNILIIITFVAIAIMGLYYVFNHY